MKKAMVVMLIIFFIMVAIVTLNIKAKQDDEKNVKKINSEYEQYLGKTIYGTDVTTIINKAIDSNEHYKIQKDENGNYVDDEKYCIKIELNMITIEKTYQMEQINRAGLTEFVKNFNTVTFECTRIEHHSKTGRVSKIVFTQLEE